MSEFIGPVLPLHLSASKSSNGSGLENKSLQHDETTQSNSSPERSSSSSKSMLNIVHHDPKAEITSKRGVKRKQIPSDDEEYGPALPPGFTKASHIESGSDSEDDNVIGPLPSSTCTDAPLESVVQGIERRAMKMKGHLEGSDKGPAERETWMLELPAEKSSLLGLGPRTFSRHGSQKSGDRSVWTDTPADKERKQKEKKEGKRQPSFEEIALARRDKDMEKMIGKYNADKRGESLLDMHRKKLSKKHKKKDKKEKKKKDKKDKSEKKEKVKKPERQPFNREEDLQVNRFDEAQKQSIIKKSQELNTRFFAGKQKFL